MASYITYTCGYRLIVTMLRFPINQTPRNESEDASTQEISPVDIAYTVLEVLSEACLAVVIITYIATE